MFARYRINKYYKCIKNITSKFETSQTENKAKSKEEILVLQRKKLKLVLDLKKNVKTLRKYKNS